MSLWAEAAMVRVNFLTPAELAMLLLAATHFVVQLLKARSRRGSIRFDTTPHQANRVAATVDVLDLGMANDGVLLTYVHLFIDLIQFDYA